MKTVLTHQRLMESSEPTFQAGLTLYQAQQIIYDFLLEIVKFWPPEDVLDEFRHLFIQHNDSVSSQTLPALHVILFANDETEFRYTIKRCCYILINNWELARHFDYIQHLVDLFEDPLLQRRTLSPTLKRLRVWLNNFINSQDFQELRLFAARLAEDRTINRPGEWVSRYTSYLLAPQYIDESNPLEQRQAARALSQRLKAQYKFNLALYTAHGHSNQGDRTAHNPTDLGDNALQLIKAIVAKRGEYSYRNLARLFLEQTQGNTYASFKTSLPRYLLYTVSSNPIAKQLHDQLATRLADLYSEFDDDPVDSSLRLRTSNRVIDYLMTENREEPSPLFSLVLSQGNALTLAILLLKLVLISRQSHPYLEVRIADLLRYYERFPRHQCQWVINFLEVFQVTFAIYAEDIEYNLVKVSTDPTTLEGDDLETCRIFSQLLSESPLPGQADEDLPD